MQVCNRRGWTLQKWKKQPAIDKEYYLAWEYRRLGKISDFYQQLQEQKANTPEVVALIRLAQDLL